MRCRRETQVWSLGQEDPLEEEWQPNAVFLPGKSHGQRSLVGYSPWGDKESDMTEQLHTKYLNQIIKLFGVGQSDVIWQKYTESSTNYSGQIWKFFSYLKVKLKVLVAQSCPVLHDPVDCSPSGSYVHGILQARILEWVAIPFSRGTSQPGIKLRSPTLQADSLVIVRRQAPFFSLAIAKCFAKFQETQGLEK